jgi:hypothetical protein
MNVMCTIQLQPGDPELTMTPDEMATSILNGLGGDPAKDLVNVSVMQPPTTGMAGNPLPPPPPPDNILPSPPA